MNQATVDIAKRIAKEYGPRDMNLARRVQDHMSIIQGLDFSECSKREFNLAVDLGYEAVAMGWSL